MALRVFGGFRRGRVGDSGWYLGDTTGGLGVPERVWVASEVPRGDVQAGFRRGGLWVLKGFWGC